MKRFLILGMLLLGLPAWAQEKPLVVDVSLMSPCVIKNGDKYSGFDVDLWEEVAAIIGREYVFREVPFPTMLSDVEQGKVDVALGGISVTEKREKKLDFSYPYFKSGLMILAESAKRDSLGSSVARAIYQLVFSWNFLKVLMGLGFVVLTLGTILKIIEELFADNPTIRPGLPGVIDGAWCIWAQMTTMGFGDIVPKNMCGRMLSLPSYVIGAIMLATIVSTISSVVMVDAIKKDQAVINGPRDLFGKNVTTVNGTTSIQFLERYDAKVIEAADVDKAIAKFLNGEADALVFDSPVIMYFVNNYKGDKPIAAVEKVFDEQDYAFALPQGSKLREEVNRAILEVIENGKYQQIYQKWFGKN